MSAAVTLTVVPGDAESYAGILATAREKIRIEDLGIPEVRPRRAKTGGLKLELSGPGREEKEEVLANRCRELLQDRAQVAHPTKTGEVRVSGLDDSAKPKDGRSARSGRTGVIRSSPNGLGTLWVNCPRRRPSEATANLFHWLWYGNRRSRSTRVPSTPQRNAVEPHIP
ncbi:hypothetical protein WH47_09474 [Habropoda laboriosa]|uniref:Uncharacterized protein n=1 Tax=Habropoda laboriosa TaxID=597456 RepID=A0A0L7QJ11_9HYME|nr:hypothetical protein WH47_09474 [Habropoda laboriosa]